MNILIIVPRFVFRPVDYYNIPLGLLYVASVVRQYGNVSILNLNETYRQDDERVIRYKIKDVDVVMTGGLSPHYPFIKEIVDTVKKYKDIPIIVGGGLVTSQPDVVAKILGADLYFSGEVEKIVGINEYTGAVYSQQNKKIDLDSTFPAYDLFNMELYLIRQRPSDSIYRMVVDEPRDAAIIASRGCPYQCTFCFHPTGEIYRQRSLDSVFQEIEMLVENYNINILSVYDELFAVSKERLTQFCERIKKFGLHWSCQLRVDGVDLDTLKLLKDSGCYIISFGIESGSNKILGCYKKGITVEQINKALEWSKQVGIVVQGNIILGAEEETLDTVVESMEWWKQHKEYNLSVGPVIPYPGTAMYEQAVKSGKIDAVKFLEDGCSSVSCCDVDVGECNDIIQKYFDQYPVKIRDLIPNSVDGLGCVSFSFKTICPYCGYEQTWNNFVLDRITTGIRYCKNCCMRYFLSK